MAPEGCQWVSDPQRLQSPIVCSSARTRKPFQMQQQTVFEQSHTHSREGLFQRLYQRSGREGYVIDFQQGICAVAIRSLASVAFSKDVRVTLTGATLDGIVKQKRRLRDAPPMALARNTESWSDRSAVTPIEAAPSSNDRPIARFMAHRSTR
jgi:hypothetical protein